MRTGIYAQRIPLESPSPQSRTAGDSATLGRFAAAHKAMFGETPLQVLHSAHRTHRPQSEIGLRAAQFVGRPPLCALSGPAW
jgi:hypothetical protein